MDLYKQKGNVQDVMLKIPMSIFSIVTVSLPAISLAICFFTGFFFRFEEVNDTMCEVQNYLPSISAVTGITPQTYLWRALVALHSAPRFAVAVMYYNLHCSRAYNVDADKRPLFYRLVRLNFWLNCLEDMCLLLVTCISNKENYPVHEKIFVGFMVFSIAYMLLNTILFVMAQPDTISDDESRSLWWKKFLFLINSSATVGLIFFFILHRLYCTEGAFSWFSLCEYFIAYSNMGYHFTGGFFDFRGKYFLFASFEQTAPAMTNGAATTSNNNKDKTL